MSTTPFPLLPDPLVPDDNPGEPKDPDLNPYPEPEIDPTQDPDEQLPHD